MIEIQFQLVNKTELDTENYLATCLIKSEKILKQFSIMYRICAQYKNGQYKNGLL